MHQLAAARGVAGLLMRPRPRLPFLLAPRAPTLTPTPPLRTPTPRHRTSASSSSSAAKTTSSADLLSVVHHPLFSAPLLPPGHRFPMQVFQRIHDRLLASGDVLPAQIHAPQGDGFSPTDDELANVHTREYLAALSGPEGLDAARARRIGFGADAFSAEAGGRRALLMRRTRAEVAGTLLTARLALERGLAVCTAGGTHHAKADTGGGYCVVNDLAYAAAGLVAEGAVGKIAIVDLDVHQGDGTAAIFSGGAGGAGGRADDDSSGSGNGDDDGRRSGDGGSDDGGGSEGSSPVPPWVRARVFTLSVHAASNFPARKEASSLDVPLPDGCGDADYLCAVAGALDRVLEWLQEREEGEDGKSAPLVPPPLHPCLVLYDAGVDVHASDALGRLSVSDAGLRRRDALVLDFFLAHGVPVAGVVGGGYADDLDVLAERHMHLHRAALEMWEMHGLAERERRGRAGEAVAAAAAAAA